MRMHNPPHPGTVIRKFLDRMSVAAGAKHLAVNRVTLSRVLNGKAAVSPEMAVRLARAFGTSTSEVWLGMQAQCDLWQIERRKRIRVDLLPHLQQSRNGVPAGGKPVPEPLRSSTSSPPPKPHKSAGHAHRNRRDLAEAAQLLCARRIRERRKSLLIQQALASESWKR